MSGNQIKFFAMLMLTVSFAVTAPANEAAPPAGDKKEEGGVNKERPWVEVENKLGLLRSKRDAMTLSMKKLREERDLQPTGSQGFKDKMKEYLTVYKQWVTVGEDYNKLLGVLKYRYPERVLKAGAGKAEQMEHKTPEQLDAELGIDGKLNKSLRNVRGQFGEQEGKKADPAAAESEAVKKKARENSEDSLELEPQIIIRK